MAYEFMKSMRKLVYLIHKHICYKSVSYGFEICSSNYSNETNFLFSQLTRDLLGGNPLFKQ